MHQTLVRLVISHPVMEMEAYPYRRLSYPISTTHQTVGIRIRQFMKHSQIIEVGGWNGDSKFWGPKRLINILSPLIPLDNACPEKEFGLVPRSWINKSKCEDLCGGWLNIRPWSLHSGMKSSIIYAMTNITARIHNWNLGILEKEALQSFFGTSCLIDPSELLQLLLYLEDMVFFFWTASGGDG